MSREADALKRVLEDTAHVRLAVLFGSGAADRLRRGSDIDLGLSLTSRAQVTPALSAALARAAGRPIDIVLLDDAPPLLRFEIARHGVVLVERVARAWADFRARAMIDWWDWAPTARMMHDVMAARLRVEASRGQS